MCQKLLGDARFFESLYELDRAIAKEVQGTKCSCCQGPLHQAHYPRKPRGGPAIAPYFSKRFSFCCGREGCRSRVMPPSVRFLGPKVYHAVIVILLTAISQGLPDGRFERLRRLVEVDRRTVKRWLDWWQKVFAKSRAMGTARGLFSAPVADEDLPAALLDRFAGDLRERLLLFLKFVAPFMASDNGRLKPRILRGLHAAPTVRRGRS